MSLLAVRALAVLLLLASAFGAGWGGAIKYRNGVDAQAALEQRDANDEAQRLANRNATRISDALTSDRLRSERAAADLAGQLREFVAASVGPAPGCPGRNDDPRAAAGILSDATTRDLVALQREAEAVAGRLRACQARELSLPILDHLSGDGRTRIDR
jgi:hypothetical protein